MTYKLETSAVLSEDGVYRYKLLRRWGRGPTIYWIMLNPSTADASLDDPTIRRCRGYSELWGYGGMEVFNLFAFRATHPVELLVASDPVGPMNDHYLAQIPVKDSRIIVAWGNYGHLFPDRVNRVWWVLGGFGEIECLGFTKNGQPRHPLMLSYSVKPQSWTKGNKIVVDNR